MKHVGDILKGHLSSK